MPDVRERQTAGPRKVLIVGAGPGGLAAAMLLARGGLDVTLVERAGVPGGRCSSMRLDGFRFDVGPTFFLYPRVLSEIFATCGYDLAREVELVRLDPQYRIVFGGGGELVASPDVATMERAIAALAPQDAPQLRRFMADNRRKLEAFRPALASPFHGWGDVLSREMLALLPLLQPHRSLHRYIAGYFSDPRVQLAFTFQSKYLGMSPYQCPSLFSILSFLEYEAGVYHPIGGCGAVSERMAAIAAEMGVRVVLDAPVERLEFEGRRPVQAHTPKGAIPFDALVVNADFARAMTSLVPDRLRRRWTDKRLARKRFSCSTFMLYLGLRGRLDDVAHHTIYVAQDYARNLAEIGQRHVLSDDPSFYVQNACITDPGLAPAGMSTLYVLVPVTHQHPNVTWDAATTAAYRQLAFRQLEKLGIADLENRIVAERVVTPADWEAGHNIHLGATFNLTHNLAQMLHLRPRNRFEDLDGVYIVGGGTHPGSGLPVIYEGARISSRLLLEDFGLDHRFLDDLTPLPAAGDVAAYGAAAAPLVDA